MLLAQWLHTLLRFKLYITNPWKTIVTTHNVNTFGPIKLYYKFPNLPQVKTIQYLVPMDKCFNVH